MAGTMSLLNEQLEEIISCPICKDSCKDPRQLPCIHTFCCECISGWIATDQTQRHGKSRCPMCRHEFQVPEGGGAGLPKNIFVMQTLEVMKLFGTIAEEMACEVCDKKASATKLCTTCLQRLCEECCMSHQKIRTTRSHRLYNLRCSSEESAEVARMMKSYCEEHEEHTLEMYCSECAEVICLLCHALSHSGPGHTCLHVDDVADKNRQQMKKYVDCVTSVVNHDSQLISHIEKSQKELKESGRKAKTDIANHAKALKAKIDQQARDLSAKADKVVRDQVEKMNEKRAKIAKSTSIKRGHRNYLKQVCNNGTSVNLARDVNALLARVKKIQPEAEAVDNSQYVKFDSVNLFSFQGDAMRPVEIGSVSLASNHFERDIAACLCCTNMTPGDFVQYMADNMEHNVRTLDGFNTFHVMGIIAT